MADVFNTAVSGLIAFQNALAVTSNNIANANTPGYSVENPLLTPRPPDPGSGLAVGNGVDVTSVGRAYNQFAVAQLRSGNGALGQQSAYLDIATQVDNAIGSATNGVSTALSGFFNAWQTLASNPTSTSSRQQVLAQAQTLATTINQTASQLQQLTGNVNGEIQSTVATINSLTSQIGQLNQTIAVQTATNAGQPPNTLLDQRDQLLNQLSSLTSVKTTTEPNGAIDVFVGSGQGLVVGNQVTQLSTKVNRYDATQLDVALGTGAVQQVITGSLGGGQLGGLLQVSSQVIVPALNSLGQIATGLAVAVNNQQAHGLDGNGQLGLPIFSVAAPQVLGAATNTGTAAISAAPINSATIGALTASNYVLSYQGGTWSATVAGSGQPVTVTGAGTLASPLSFAGLSLVVGGAPANGDSFLVEPTAAAGSNLRVALSNPAGVAAASPLASAAAIANTGTASLGAPATPLIGDPSLLMPATIRFLSPTTYTVTTQTSPSTSVTSAVQTLAGNGVITAPAVAGVVGSGGGWSVTLSGAAAAGDSFSVAPNGAGDNGNALAMAALQNQGVLSGGTVGLATAYATLVGQVGTQTQQATSAQSAQQAVVSQAQQTVSNISGVNLDEEAAHMLQWQQAYAAAAKVVSTADGMFQTLIAAIRAG
jgi:flagellar hook-associated protein 1 FlgK